VLNANVVDMCQFILWTFGYKFVILKIEHYFYKDNLMPERINNITLAALLFIVFMGFNLLTDQDSSTAASAAPLEQYNPESIMQVEETQPPTEPDPDPIAIRWPYDNYTLTQGPHGQSYGHLAVDLSAGNGAPVLSPINGVITALYTDQYGNTTLLIENDIWEVLMLHGNYNVSVGEQIAIGQQVGTESNNGYTVDWLGRSCRGRDCGYHTHLNVFDKRIGSNVNPLEVIGH
jgi:murein DD-endopeptidase MepM/ murein hydrolase activator NlpD